MDRSAQQRLLGLPAGERRRAQDLVDRWGAVAVVATRPVPVLAEAVVIMAGAAGASAFQVAVAAAGGSPAAVLYALAGSLLVDAASGVAVFLAVLALAAVFWLISTRQHRGPGLRRT